MRSALTPSRSPIRWARGTGLVRSGGGMIDGGVRSAITRGSSPIGWARGTGVSGGAGREIGRLVAGDAHDVGGFAGVTGVEDASELVVAVEDGVGFVYEKGRAEFFDDAEEGG